MRMYSQPCKTVLFAALMASLAAVLLQGIAAIRLNASLQSGDQGAYLHLSLAQAEGRALTDGNRHPLYPALLIPMAERSPAFFAHSRWASLFIGGALLLLAAFWELRQRKDPVSAVLVILFLGTQVQMVRTLSEIWCEPLLYLLLFCLWLMTDRNSQTTGTRQTTLRWLLPGVLCGALYLTKGTGLQVAVAFWAATLVIRRDWRGTALAVAVFLVVVSPLLYWNIKTYGSPLYSFASTHNMWFDEADEIWYDDPATLPTLGSYIQSHTLSEIALRLGKGLVLEAQMALQLAWTDWALPEGNPMGLVLIFLLVKVGVVVLIGMGVWYGKGQRTLTSRWGGAFLLFLVLFMVPSFGWYAQLTNEPRFLMMLVPIGAVLLARVGSRGFERLYGVPPSPPPQPSPARGEGETRSLPPSGGGLGWGGDLSRWYGHILVTSFVGLILLGAVCSFAASGNLAWKTRRIPSPEVFPLARRVLTEVDQLPGDTTLAFGPSHGLPTWLSRGDLKWRPIPWRIDWERFLVFLRREGIRYVLLDQETLARRPYLSPLMNPSGTPTSGWRIVFRDRDQEGFFLLWVVEEDLSPNPLPSREGGIGLPPRSLGEGGRGVR